MHIFFTSKFYYNLNNRSRIITNVLNLFIIVCYTHRYGRGFGSVDSGEIAYSTSPGMRDFSVFLYHAWV